MAKKWMVYIHTNKENGKRYVGITSKSKPEQRWGRDGSGYSKGTHFASAISKYGWDSFDHKVIVRNIEEHDAKNLECFLISALNLQNPKYGYNMTSGGDGTPNYKPSEETRRKLSLARRRENLSEETLRRRSEGLKGRKFSDDHKRKIGVANSSPVDMLSLSGEFIKTFPSMTVVEMETGVLHSHISQCCTGKRQTSGNFKWRYSTYS